MLRKLMDMKPDHALPTTEEVAEAQSVRRNAGAPAMALAAF
jgi:hypothetical protein